MSALGFTVEGEPKGKGRPKFTRRGKHVRVYTPKETQEAQDVIHAAWEGAGAVTLDGPVRIALALVIERPASHFLSDGVTLSAAGRRKPLPDNKKPDVDNALKLVMDALNGHAWLDDVQVVSASVTRHWGNASATHVTAAEIPTGGTA